ncbi:MAG: CRISPR-associated endonuclease Cas2 [Peptococcaceae bacterium]|nr:CRISPR-associated endonuclease Cas2 [Peptococcaceae bacterium]
MSYRFMRIMVMFDLPVETEQQRRAYRAFRKYLVKNGFVMMQESIYTKIALNASAAQAIVGNLRKNKPPDGLVQVLKVTEKQFAGMEYIVGDARNDVVDSDERLIVL